ncbi:MAG: hypothetical protein ACYC6R_06060 [Anaerolineales bacterium]
MPKMDGFGVIAQMREWETFRNITVIVMKHLAETLQYRPKTMK